MQEKPQDKPLCVICRKEAGEFIIEHDSRKIYICTSCAGKIIEALGDQRNEKAG